MAMTLLRARKRPNGSFLVIVHLDDTKTLEDGNPDPAWCRRFDWGPAPNGTTQTAYVAQLKAETKLLCQHELANMTAADDEGTALPGEGGAL